MRSIVLHGHFYQPPRENPWLEEVEREASAAPHHDWNERIEQECYRAVVAARVLAPDGRISRIINTLEYISFNFGPTLLEWLEVAAPDTYVRILDADRRSIARLGHGNAIAQPYHHAILPLSSRRDKVTEVRWGIADFRRRFGREPEGMWLPETALDDETLDVLAQEGIRFTIIAPGQVEVVPNDGQPGLYTTTNGRTIALCIYDGDISHGIAFDGLLNDGAAFGKRLLARGERRRTPRDGTAAVTGPDHWEPDPESDGGTRPLAAGIPSAVATAERHARRHRLVAAATDGETYGHHHRFGEMALARVILDFQTARTVRLENFASYLARHPAVDEVKIHAPSAWSCAHGVERWRSECGCRMRGGTHQRWRTPLREAIAELADGLHAVYEREATRYFDDPWAVRDAYGEVVATPHRIESWVDARVRSTAASPVPDSQSPICSPQSLLEMERGALRIFTSCAWFFDDIAGLEPLEVLRYAARAIELAGDDGPRLEAAFLARLAEAESNEVGIGTGRDVYLAMAKPKLGQFARLAGSVAAARAVAPNDPSAEATSAALAVVASNGSVTVHQRRTGERGRFDVAVSTTRDVPASVVAAPHSPAAVIARVSSTPPLELVISEMTERQRTAVENGVRRRLIAEAFGEAAASASPATGAALFRAVTSAVKGLGERGDGTAGRVVALLDLLELEGLHVPFDAQTTFYETFLARPGADLDPVFAAIAARLGFGPTAGG
jgi:hypothetical protein